MRGASLYPRLPVPLQNLAVGARGVQIRATRYGGDFDMRLEAAIRRADRGSDALLVERDARLVRALHEFRTSVPRFRSLSASEIDADPYGVLASLSITDKSQVREQPAAFRADPQPKESRTTKTSGSTGSALHLRSTRTAEREQWAVWWRYRSWHGLLPGQWHGLFGGKQVVPTGGGAPYWRVARPLHQVFYSSLHIDRASAPAYVKDIDQRGLSWLHGYPSAIAALARSALATGVPPPSSVDTISGGSEGFGQLNRQVLGRWFGGRIIEHYGLAEGVANLSQCVGGRLHVDEDFSVVEFLETEMPGQHEIVGTNLTNFAQAFVRYRTGDLAVDVRDSCPCGWHGRSISHVDGRMDDMIVTADGHLVGRLGQLFYDTTSVASAQIVQEVPGRIDVYVVPAGTSVLPADLSHIEAAAADRLGPSTGLSFHEVQQVPYVSPSGKHRLVVRLFDLGTLNSG